MYHRKLVRLLNTKMLSMLMSLSVLGGCGHKSHENTGNQGGLTADINERIRKEVIEFIGGWKGCTASCLEEEIAKKIMESKKQPTSEAKFPNMDYLDSLKKIKFGKAKAQKHSILPDDDISGLYATYVTDICALIKAKSKQRADIKKLVLYTYLASIGLKLTSDFEELVSSESPDEAKFESIIKEFNDALSKAISGVALKKEKLDKTQISYYYDADDKGNYHNQLDVAEVQPGMILARAVEIAWNIYKCTVD